MKYTRNQLSKLEVGTTSNWVIQFEDSVYNIIDGGFFPAISVKFGLFEPINSDIEVANGFKLKIPTAVNPPESVEIEFYDNHKFSIHQALYDYINNTPMAQNGRSFINLSDSSTVKSGGVSFSIFQFDKVGTAIAHYSIIGFPSSPLNFSGDQEFKAVQNNISFDILSFDKK